MSFHIYKSEYEVCLDLIMALLKLKVINIHQGQRVLVEVSHRNDPGT
jgi:hypothetical protein